MIDLAAIANNGFFGFDKVADFSVGAELSPGANTGEGPQDGMLADGRLVDHCIGMYCHAIANMTVADMAVGANSDTGANTNDTFKDAVDVDNVICACA